MHIVYLSIGSNLGNREENLRRAVRMIGQRAGRVTSQSSVYKSKAWGFESVHRFANIAIRIETGLSPLDLLHTTQQIELDMGRTGKTVNGQYQDRIIDIDILLYDKQQVNLPELRIPHPLMQLRDFVMIPLQEILEK
ncbi:MAG: 2-amino-4-hydroxy-6-hydroxymethyldihydropteridine diphosphokinase [Paludibacteraceae bacterium]|nr:2-amino-4-hydroxy-6-hydroxymethyldihydropteridine diphosphokinase [Paludibacteraceae bacterium]MBQ9706249.1 2-amino-4-hydroxy-6-hydroxymethyldihydropteridine diphosphokinase [Paludibacteraceae bacterium]